MKQRLQLFVLLLLSLVSASAQEEAITDTTLMGYKLFSTIPYYRVNYTYQSVEPDGITPVTMSAAMVFPEAVFKRTQPFVVGTDQYDASGLLLNNHFTITRNSEAPTQTKNMDVEGPVAVFGASCIVISPDGYGFGATVDRPQTYLMADVTARHNVDAVRAARRLLEKMGYTYGKLFNQIGYSQGGHSAMAVQRYLDTHGYDADAIGGIDYTFCGDGPYDIISMLDTLMLPDARYTYPCAIPLIIHGQIGGAGLNISYKDCFREPFDQKAIEWLDAKTYSSTAINDSIYKVVGANSLTGILVDDLLATENFTTTNEKMQPFYKALKDNSLVSGWQPNDKTHFYVYHSSEDEIVPYFCMEHLTDFLSNDCGIGEDRLDIETSVGDHQSAAALFVVNSMVKILDQEQQYKLGEYIPVSIHQLIADTPTSSTNRKGWFNLQGQRLPSQPHTPGLYIHDGKKVVVGR
ncbi:MAG: hypothetical protein K5893_02745 [Prevotella sp.]|nr:hypothetical protein [Prevotella sp.]